jgi:hypothetical protein
MNKKYLNKIFLEVLNKLKLKLNELNELKKLKLEVLKKLKESKSELKKLNELKSELNALNELIIKTPITYNGKTYHFKSQDGIIVYGDIYDDKLIKINYSYDLAIKSPVTIDNENLYLDIYNDIKTAIDVEDKEKILQDMDEESLNLQDMDEESLNLRNITSSEVYIAGKLISKITETDDYKHFRILKALKNLFKVAKILILNINEDTVGGNKVYNGNSYIFPKNDTSLSVKYNSSIDKLKTTIAYLNSGQTLEIKNAITIINIFSNLADASPYYYSYSSPGSSSDKSFLYEDVLKIVKAKAAEEAAAEEAEEEAARAAAEEEAARAEAARAAEEEAARAARAEAARAAEEEAARAAEEEAARARAEAARARAEAARAAEEEGGTGGGKRKSKGNSKKVSKKPVISQKKESIYKEILGKQMKIYKMPDSRKEYVKYKGELLHISDYKDLMKQKAIAKTKTKVTKATQQKAIEKTKVTKETKATKETNVTQQKAIEKTKTKTKTNVTKETKATQQKAKAKSKTKK